MVVKLNTCKAGHHDWHFVPDYYGDPNVINGTADCSFYRCNRCGKEQVEEPSDFMSGPDPDDERDRMCDRLFDKFRG
jgi:hypothetical protein